MNENSGTQFDPVLVKYMIDMIQDGFTYKIHHYDESEETKSPYEKIQKNCEEKLEEKRG